MAQYIMMDLIVTIPGVAEGFMKGTLQTLLLHLHVMMDMYASG